MSLLADVQSVRYGREPVVSEPGGMKACLAGDRKTSVVRQRTLRVIYPRATGSAHASPVAQLSRPPADLFRKVVD